MDDHDKPYHELEFYPHDELVPSPSWAGVDQLHKLANRLFEKLKRQRELDLAEEDTVLEQCSTDTEME